MPCRILLMSLLCLALTACGPHRVRGTGKSAVEAVGAEPPRAAPGYVQWLERQSMLGAARDYTAMVSGTDLLLRAPSVAGGDRADALLKTADVWLWVHPPTLLTLNMRPVWAELAAAGDVVEALGLRGVYVAPTGESGGVWERDIRRSETGDDVISLNFAPHMGGDDAFEAFAALAARKQWQLGADVLPPFTGMGPDFFLAARRARDYSGLYMMLEAPESLWPRLPAAGGPWEAVPVEDIAPLADEGLLPPSLARDNLSWAASGGWAATGEVRGVDGRLRRWVYRGHGRTRLPVLSWDDPSGSARKVVSASIIRQIGVLRQTLAGIHAEPLAGLDAAARGSAATLEPAPSALRDMAREVRRYGGWSVQLDAMPTPPAAEPRGEGADFTADGIAAPAVEYAVLTGQAEVLRTALASAAASGEGGRRSLRRLPAVDGVDLRGLDARALDAVRQCLKKSAGWGDLLEEGAAPRLYATSATLAALAAGIGPRAAAGPEAEPAIRRGHLLLTLFKAGLPGLFFISGQDVAGTLSLPDGPPSLRTRGAWGIGAAAAEALNRQGAPRAPVAYAPVTEQLRTPGSYADVLRRAAAVRRRYGLARSEILAAARTVHAGSAGVFLRLPSDVGGGILLLLANFSEKAVRESVLLPAGARGRTRDILQERDMGEEGAALTVSLAPLECLWLLVAGQ